tara:strand:- start:57 stop:653 length:597 start_codon:yes stop_codon:yes gene_type:complete
MFKLSTNQVYGKLKSTDFRGFGKPKKNKGVRGQLIELALGISNNNKLTDLVDGEIKSFTLGESIAVTSLKHCLPDIIDGTVEFEDSKVGQKLAQTIYVGFTRDNDYVGTELLNEELDPQHYQQLAEDYGYIAANIKAAYQNGATLHTITGPNNLLQIRTKASKNKHGEYTPLCYNGVELKDKYMAFYLLADFGKQVIK